MHSSQRDDVQPKERSLTGPDCSLTSITDRWFRKEKGAPTDSGGGAPLKSLQKKITLPTHTHTQ